MRRPRCAVATIVSLLPLLSCASPLGKLGDVIEEEETQEQLPPPSERSVVLTLDDGAVDVLFVVDNSGSMGEEQASIAPEVARFANEATTVHGGDLRIGFTTTDNGNPWCQATAPEAGNLVLSACTSRLTQFVFDGAESLDLREEACLSLCGLDSLTTTATTTHVDTNAAPRPWIETSPVGNNSPLEAMNKAVERAESPSEPSYGFLRPWARLVVVFLTDETDSSSAVMRSLTRYVERLEGVEASKSAYHPEDAVAVALIGGVPVGYGDGSVELDYTRGVSGDDFFIADFGVDPGCSSPMGMAVPPVRLKALAELFPAPQGEVIYSVCRQSFAPAFDLLYQGLVTPRSERMACMPSCLADVDSGQAGTQAECEIIMTWGTVEGRSEARLHRCGEDGVAEGDEACYLLRVDEDAEHCAASGSNAELELVLREGFQVRGELGVEAKCEQAPSC